MGLFGFGKTNKGKSSSRKILDELELKRKDMKDELDYQNELLSRVNKAREKYKKDKDIESAIKEYEYAFVEADPPCKTSQDIDLANLYIKAGLHDKAWGYLNQLQLRRRSPDPEIRFYQAKILKKEGRYAYAIEMYAKGYYYKTFYNAEFQTEKFLKDISPCVKKLGWNQEKVDTITETVVDQVKKNGYDDKELSDRLKKLLYDNIEVKKGRSKCQKEM